MLRKELADLEKRVLKTAHNYGKSDYMNLLMI